MSRRNFLRTGAIVVAATALGTSLLNSHDSSSSYIPREHITKMYSMTPEQLAHDINILRKEYKLDIPRINDSTELANLVRIMYFEEEFYKHNDPKHPEFNDQYFYDSFKGIADVILNRVLFAQDKLYPVTSKLASDPALLGNDFNSIYHDGTPSKPGRLRSDQFNCLSDRRDFFIDSADNSHFCIEAYSRSDGVNYKMSTTLTRLAVKAFVNTVLGLDDHDDRIERRKDKETRLVRIGKRNDTTNLSMFYMNPNPKASIQWWDGNEIMEPQNIGYVAYATARIGGHVYYSVGFIQELYEKLTQKEKSQFIQFTPDRRNIVPVKGTRQDLPDPTIWIPKNNIGQAKTLVSLRSEYS